MSPTILAALIGVAFVAGAIDAIAGGGGLVTLPALLLVLPTPQLALGTNKGQSVFGSAASLASFTRAGRVDRARALPAFIGAFVGALLGVRLVLWIRPDALRPVVLVLLVGVAIFFVARPVGRRAPIAPRAAAPALAFAVAFAAGVYDGFFGPGTGTLLIAVYSAVFGDELTAATANAKVANFASNVGAVLCFALASSIVWRVALPMAAGQALGGVVGARIAVRGGNRVVRGAVVAVSVALVVKLAADMR